MPPLLGALLVLFLVPPAPGAQQASTGEVTAARSEVRLQPDRCQADNATPPPLSSLTDAAAVLGAERLVAQALPAASDEAAALAKEIDAIDADISANFKAIEMETERVTQEAPTLQPAIDAYATASAALQADDAKWHADIAPLQAQIGAYLATPENERDAAEYDRLAAAKAPFDARRAQLVARQAALTTQYEEIGAAMARIQQPLEDLREADAELLARRKATVARLGDAFGQVEACSTYATALGARLATVNEVPSPALTSGMAAAAAVLIDLRRRGFGSAEK